MIQSVQSVQLTKENLRRKNFSPDEFFVSETAKRLGIENYPPKLNEIEILHCLMSTADLMQNVRELLGEPIKINSAYRCWELNRAIGSSDSSQHTQGLACDFICPDFGTPEKIVKFLHSKNIRVDQCLCEGEWVHISKLLHFDAKNRMMFGYYLPDPETGKRIFKKIN